MNASTFALLIYVVVSAISGIIKLLAQKEEARKAAEQEPVFFEEDRAQFEEMAEGDTKPQSPERMPSIFDEMEFETKVLEELEPVSQAGRKIPSVKWRPNLAQAVIMSEILSSPRAKRPWPNR
ncbi:MAG: hypothetical protein QM392_07890 [Bacillota bacterium]|nr:hypothetical protein [Bacillota bacterium]